MRRRRIAISNVEMEDLETLRHFYDKLQTRKASKPLRDTFGESSTTRSASFSCGGSSSSSSDASEHSSDVFASPSGSNSTGEFFGDSWRSRTGNNTNAQRVVRRITRRNAPRSSK